jgi:RNA polymerase sigma factor (TIGR02999 family)
VTGLLLEWNQGNSRARAQLISLVYRELRKRAGSLLKLERADHTLQPTALVHEVYLKLIDQQKVSWRNRAHFFAIASSLMRRIVVDHARRHGASKRGGAAERVTLSEALTSRASVGRDIDLISLDAALQELAGFDPDQARVVELRFFGGLSLEETAEALGTSLSTVKRDWVMARGWLRLRLAGS